ncbi:MAG: DUF427 domain-containing protein [Planctomycetota bacterium]
MWRWRGQERPPFADEPGPGQRSVWDFPRPPRLEPIAERLIVEIADRVVAETERGFGIFETASAPTYYFPVDDVDLDLVRPVSGASFCEWKGRAAYWDAEVDGRRYGQVAWSYPEPLPPFQAVAGMLAFHPAVADRCLVGEAVALPQPGGFYGGWVTPDLAGPIKGAPGSSGW